MGTKRIYLRNLNQININKLKLEIMIDYEQILTSIVKRRNSDPTLMKKFFLKVEENEKNVMIFFGTTEQDSIIVKQIINEHTPLETAKQRAFRSIVDKILDKVHDSLKTANF